MRRALTRQYLVKEHDRLGVSDDLTVRGRFELDDETDNEVPLLVIYGKVVTWNRFDQILSSFEGWQFKVEIYDSSDER